MSERTNKRTNTLKHIPSALFLWRMLINLAIFFFFFSQESYNFSSFLALSNLTMISLWQVIVSKEALSIRVDMDVSSPGSCLCKGFALSLFSLPGNHSWLCWHYSLGFLTSTGNFLHRCLLPFILEEFFTLSLTIFSQICDHFMIRLNYGVFLCQQSYSESLYTISNSVSATYNPCNLGQII